MTIKQTLATEADAPEPKGADLLAHLYVAEDLVLHREHVPEILRGLTPMHLLAHFYHHDHDDGPNKHGVDAARCALETIGSADPTWTEIRAAPHHVLHALALQLIAEIRSRRAQSRVFRAAWREGKQSAARREAQAVRDLCATLRVSEASEASETINRCDERAGIATVGSVRVRLIAHAKARSAHEQREAHSEASCAADEA